MSRILLADDSPHAQRMGELILREEGHEVVTVTDGATALLRLRDVDPDLILVTIRMPTRTGYEICELVKSDPRHQHTRVVLTAGALDDVDTQEAERVRADGVLKKPFEASVVIETVQPLLAAAQTIRGVTNGLALKAEPEPAPPPPEPARPDPELVRAAVTIALDAAMTDLIDKITEQVLIALEPPSQKDA